MDVINGTEPKQADPKPMIKVSEKWEKLQKLLFMSLNELRKET